jgi:hypothetical protein
MQTKTSYKTGQWLLALFSTTLIVGTGSAQTIVIDSAPALNLTTQINSGIALSSIAIDPITGNAQVRTQAGNINSCTGSGNPPGRSVTVSAPASAAPSAVINVAWTANNFTGTTTCTVSGGTNTTGWTGTNLPYPATSSLQVTLAATQPASYTFTVTCSDGSSAQGSAATSVSGGGGGGDCSDPLIGTYNGATLNVNAVRNWENTFVTGGQTNVPFPGPPNRQFNASLSRGAYDSMRFVVPLTLPQGFRADLSNFVTTSSATSVLVAAVSECQGDFRPSLNNSSLRRLCTDQGGVGGTSIGVVVDAGNGPYNSETCSIVRGRTYFVNTSFGTSSNQTGGSAFCVDDACSYNLEYRQTRRSE